MEVLLKWGFQMGFVVLTTSQNPKHQRSNLELSTSSSWRLSDDALAELATLKPFYSGRIGPIGIDLAGMSLGR